MGENERKRIPRWKKVINWIVILAALYWVSAAPTLSLWMKYEDESNYANGMAWNMTPPQWWCIAYAPVMWAADRDILGPITMAPFEWLGVDSYVTDELWYRRGLRF